MIKGDDNEESSLKMAMTIKMMMMALQILMVAMMMTMMAMQILMLAMSLVYGGNADIDAGKCDAVWRQWGWCMCEGT